MICNICCKESSNNVFQAKEMLGGSRDSFDYLECSECGSLSLLEVPSDMSIYYGNSHYGSFSESKSSYFKKIFRVSRNKYAFLRKGGLLGRFLNWLRPLTYEFTCIAEHQGLDAKILDVGCGAGWYINWLHEIGFTNVNGIDPFIDKDQFYQNGVTVKKKYVHEVDGKYDAILSHHQFEHVPDPLKTLCDIKAKLNPDGICILTVPVAEDLYRKYKQNCYLIQAPQHFFLYSIRGFLILAKKAGFKLELMHRDARTTAMWYKYSELWKKDIAHSEIEGGLDNCFDKIDLKEFSSIENRLVQAKSGDNVTFLLKAVNSE